MFDWEILNLYLPEFLPGLLTTLQLMSGALVVGLFFAIILALLSMSQCRFISLLANGYIFFIRGTPLLAQLFLIYFGLSQFSWLRNSPLWFILGHPMACAILAFALNTAAYTAVLLKGAIRAIPKEEVEAGLALGLTRYHIFRAILFPQAFRRALPAYSNEVLMIMKATSLASTITLLDIMGITQQIIAETYAAMECYLIAGGIYLLLNGVIVGIFKFLERRWSIR